VVIADMTHRVDFGGKAIGYFPLDKVRTEDILDRSADFGR
jgi:hypothetical protein